MGDVTYVRRQAGSIEGQKGCLAKYLEAGMEELGDAGE